MKPSPFSHSVKLIVLVMTSIAFSQGLPAHSGNKANPAPAAKTATAQNQTQPQNQQKTTTPAKPTTQAAPAQKPAQPASQHPEPNNKPSTTISTSQKTTSGTTTTTQKDNHNGDGSTTGTTNTRCKPLSRGCVPPPPPCRGCSGGGGNSSGLSVPPGGTKTTTPEGHTVVRDANGHVTGVLTKSGAVAHFTSTGQVSTIKTASGTTITHSSTGTNSVVSERISPSGVHYRVVSAGGRGGYVDRPFHYGGHDYMRRTYVYGGRTYVTIYRGYPYRGVVYYRYIPAYYYRPAFYGWAYAPWQAPVYWSWGWAPAPWWGCYGCYFAPYPYYSAPAFWLTDYVIAANLQAAYQAGAASAESQAPEQTPAQADANANAATVDPQIKQLIAEEVKSQLAAEQAAAQQGGSTSTSAPAQPTNNGDAVPPALDPNEQVFIVATNLDVNADGQACSLSPGDILTRIDDTPDSDNNVEVKVSKSQKSDCATGSKPRVHVADLQDMHNHFLEQMDNGLKTLADNQGKNGIPSGPAASPSSNPDLKTLPTAPDLTAATELSQQQHEADHAEKEVQQTLAPSSSTTASNRAAGN